MYITVFEHGPGERAPWGGPMAGACPRVLPCDASEARGSVVQVGPKRS